MDNYVKDTLFDLVKYSIISTCCCAGLWLATTDIGAKYKKVTSILIVPSFIITPIFVTAEYYFLTALFVTSGILAFLRIVRGVHDKMAVFTEG